MEHLKIIYAQASRWALPFVVVLLMLSFYTCHQYQDQAGDLSKTLDENQARTVQLANDRGQLVAQNSQLVEKFDGELKAYTDSVFAMKQREERLIKSVESYTRIVQQAKFKDKTAGFTDPPPGNDQDPAVVYLPQPDDTNLIRVPRPFAYQDSTINFAGTVKRRGVTIDSLTVPNTLHLRTAVNKSGFLGLGRVTVVQAFNSNPAIVNTGLTSIKVKNRGTWWQRWGKPIVFLGAGGFIGTKIKK